MEKYAKEANVLNVLYKKMLRVTTEKYRSEYKKEPSEEKLLELKKDIQTILLDYLGRIDHIVKFRNRLELRRFFPLYVVDTYCYKVYDKEFKALSENEKLDVAFKLGYDRDVGVIIDVSEYTYENKRSCGEVLVGDERYDDDWCNLIIDGVRVSSLQAQLKNKPDESLSKELEMMGGSF